MPPVRQEMRTFKQICLTLLVIDSDDLKGVLLDAFAPTLPSRSLQLPVGSVYRDDAISKAGLQFEVRSHPSHSP